MGLTAAKMKELFQGSRELLDLSLNFMELAGDLVVRARVHRFLSFVTN
jgi:hypothetical protein